MSCSGRSYEFSELQEELLIRATGLTLPNYVIDSISYSVCFYDLLKVLDLVDNEIFREFLEVNLRKNGIYKEKKDENNKD